MTFRKLLRLARAAVRHGGGDIRLARRSIHSHGAMQRLWELASLVSVVRRLQPRTVVEIGTYRGGTLACWTALAAADAHLICIDRLDPEFGVTGAAAQAAHLRRLLRPGQRLTFLPLDSQAASTALAVRSALGDAAVDFLWIDGDHHDAAVRRDFSLYAPLVRAAGLIAFHDIHPDPAFPGNQSHLLWRELRRDRPVREFIDQDHAGGGGMGIGVVAVDPARPFPAVVTTTPPG